MNKQTFETKVDALLAEWEKGFRALWKKGRHYSAVIEIDGGRNARLFEDEMFFIIDYVRHMQLNGPSSNNLERIDYFLSMQGERDEDLMELRFIGGSPIEAYVFVNDLGDIDIADIHAITGATCLIVYQANNKEWAIQEAAAFIESFIEDFEWDGDKICFSASNRGTFLEIKIKGFAKGKR